MKKEKKIIEIRPLDREYPDLLRQLGKNAPACLYCIGDTSLLDRRKAAVVGARKASQYGKWAAFSAGSKLAEYEIVTVSGMAYGCDTEAHRGALHKGGKTIAVLGSGVDICYPSPSRDLYEQISEEGLLISEVPPGRPPMKHSFVRRNRIISGLSELVVVVEASISSGSLITAEFAADQGRDVLALPGNISNINAAGSNKLLRDGAIPVLSFGDIIEQMGISPWTSEGKKNRNLGRDEKKLLDLLEHNGELTAGALAELTGFSVSRTNAMVSILEIKGYVTTSSGKIFVAK